MLAERIPLLSASEAGYSRVQNANVESVPAPPPVVLNFADAVTGKYGHENFNNSSTKQRTGLGWTRTIITGKGDSIDSISAETNTVALIATSTFEPHATNRFMHNLNLKICQIGDTRVPIAFGGPENARYFVALTTKTHSKTPVLQVTFMKPAEINVKVKTIQTIADQMVLFAQKSDKSSCIDLDKRINRAQLKAALQKIGWTRSYVSQDYLHPMNEKLRVALRFPSEDGFDKLKLDFFNDCTKQDQLVYVKSLTDALKIID